MLNFLIINCRYTEKKLFRGSNNIDISSEEDKEHNVPKYSHSSKDYADFASYQCTCDRSISVLNRVKSFNRTTQFDDRLTGLCIIYAYRDVEINWDKVINAFANKNPRRMALINILDDEKSIKLVSVYKGLYKGLES